jgi:Na+-driven multidrug efflux pump
MRLGIPSAISSTTFSIANLIIQPIVNSFGDVGISGTAACGAIESYIFVITQSVGNTVGTFLGQNIGARNKDRVKKILIRGYTMNFVITAVLSVIVISIGKVLLGFFIPGETEAIEFGYLRMWIIIGFSFLNALANINRSALQAYGYTFMQMISNLMAVCLFSVLWVLVIYDKVIAATPFNFLISYPISWLISVSVQLTMVVVLTKNYLKGKEFKI